MRKRIGSKKKEGSRKVDVGSRKNLRVFKQNHNQGDQPEADGQIDKEDVAPGIATHNPAPEVWTNNASNGKDTRKKANGPLPVFEN